MKPLNVIYLHSHDTGRYVQPYGHAVETPHLMKFAGEGVLFRQAFCANPTCSPSRASLLSGMYPHCNGMIGLAHRGARMYDYARHLAQFLKAQGLETALAGVHHETGWKTQKEDLGYDHFLVQGLPGKMPDHDLAVARRAAEFIETPARKDKPFFLSCGFVTTHRTGSTPANVNGRRTSWFNHNLEPHGDGRFARPPLPLPDTPETRQDFADYAESVNRLDTYMGTVIDAVSRAGLGDNTLFIVTTDHGIAFPLMKCNLTDHGIGVMLMIRGPGGFAGGKTVDAMVSHLDLYPTICDVLEIDKPAWLQGTSLLPTLTGQEQIHDELFAEINYHAAYEPARAVRTPRYKYIRRWNCQPHPILPNCDDSVSKHQLVDAGWGTQAQQPEALYDLVMDPHEQCNRAADPALADAKKDLAGRLDAWMKQTDDPLLSGRVPPQKGMVLNPIDGYSPSDEPLPATA